MKLNVGECAPYQNHCSADGAFTVGHFVVRRYVCAESLRGLEDY